MLKKEKAPIKKTKKQKRRRKWRRKVENKREKKLGTRELRLEIIL